MEIHWEDEEEVDTTGTRGHNGDMGGDMGDAMVTHRYTGDKGMQRSGGHRDRLRTQGHTMDMVDIMGTHQ